MVSVSLCVRKAVAAGFEVGPQLAVVVDFAVEGNPDRLVFVRQRLPPGGEVDNRQPPKPQHGPRPVGRRTDSDRRRIRAREPPAGGRLVNLGVVRPAMRNDVGHSPQNGVGDRRGPLVQATPVIPHIGRLLRRLSALACLFHASARLPWQAPVDTAPRAEPPSVPR